MACPSNSRVTKTTLDLNVKIQKDEGSPLPVPTLYCRLLGSMLYLTMTQPDIAHAIQVSASLWMIP